MAASDSRVQLSSAIITLDVPPRSLHPNARAHWRRAASEKSAYRKNAEQIVAGIVRERFGPGARPLWKKAVVRLDYYFGQAAKHGTRQHQDPDNLNAWAKTPIDSLRGTLLDDDRDLIYLPPQQAGDALKPRLEIHVWEGDQVWKAIMQAAIEAGLPR